MNTRNSTRPATKIVRIDDNDIVLYWSSALGCYVTIPED